MLMACIVVCFTCSCNRKTAAVSVADDGKIEIAFVQINDVYEIAGVSGGKLGNLARVAAYYQDIKQRYPNSMLVLAGDFLNPSLINTMKYEGERVNGKNMIETLNAMGLDLAAFGNHEFDLDRADLQKRLDESTFDWIASNLAFVDGNTEEALYKNSQQGKLQIPTSFKKKFKDQDGTEVTIGIFSATIDSNPREYVKYYNADSCAHELISKLNGSTDVIVGLTHLTIAEDIALAKKEPSVSLIMGGHEHDHMLHQVGPVRITKADANAKTLYLHVLKYNKLTDEVAISSTLVEVNESLRKDPKTEAVIQKWIKILSDNISDVVTNPYDVVFHADDPLDARESSIRWKQTNLGDIICESMLAASQQDAIVAIINSGSIRVDDQLYGDIAGVDVFRILPFGGSIVDVQMTGSLLKEVLDFGQQSGGKGAFLQFAGVRHTDNGWSIEGEPIDDKKDYPIITTDFLLKGYDIPFCKIGHPCIVRVDGPTDAADLRYDIRATIIQYLKSL